MYGQEIDPLEAKLVRTLVVRLWSLVFTSAGPRMHVRTETWNALDTSATSADLDVGMIVPVLHQVFR